MNRLVPTLLAIPLLLGGVTLHAQPAVDQHAILDAANALDEAIDTKDWPRVRSLLLDEVTVALPGEEQATVAADALVARWQESLHAEKSTFHLRGSGQVVFDGADSAVLRSRTYEWQRVPGIGGDELYELWADYHHELDRTEDGWRVRHYAYVPRLERGNLAVLEHRLPEPEPEPEPDDATGKTAPDGEQEETPNGETARESGSEVEKEAPPDGG